MDKKVIRQIYISIIGHQVMASINPLLSLQVLEGTLVLLLTPPGKSDKYAKNIKSIIGVNDKLEVKIIPVSLLADGGDDSPAHITIEETLAEYPDVQIYFNMAGGIGFQIAACAQVLFNCKNIQYLYPEKNCTRLYTIDNHPKIKLSKVEDIPELKSFLTWQGVNIQISADTDLAPEINKMLERCKLNLPPNTRRNVIVSGIEFDLYFNRANTAYFCKLMYDSGDHRVNKEDIRSLISLAINRGDFADLFHREILVLTNSQEAAERFETESMGKVKVAFSSKKGTRMLAEQQQILKEFIDPVVSYPAEKSFFQSSSAPPSGKTLYTFLGRSPMPTLKAIWSHCCQEVCLFYTEDDERVKFFAEKIIENQKRIPVKTIKLIPVSFFARELEGFEIKEGGEFEVNITPGTKLQAFFLSRMALRHNGRIMSILNSTQQIVTIPDNQPVYKIKSPPFNILFSLIADSNNFDFGLDKKRIERKQNQLEGLLTFFRQIIKEKVPIRKFYEKTLTLRNMEMTRDSGKQLFTLSIPIPSEPDKQYKYSTNPNDWFEELVGYVFSNKCKAEDVNLSITTFWKKDMSYRRSYTHRTENDVSARIGDTFYIISCKAGKTTAIKKAAQEVKSTAGSIDRFAIPLLAVLKHSGKPELVDDVYVFGYETLTDRSAMIALLQDSKNFRSTT